jgi:hypothetical protein
MNRFWVCLLCTIPVVSLAQPPKTVSSVQEKDEMIVAVSRKSDVLSGGIGIGPPTNKDEEVSVEPIAWLTPAGDWKAIRCDWNHPKECRAFNTNYLKKPHTYTVVSADGRGAKIDVDQMRLTPADDLQDCFGYGGKGTTSGISNADTAIASSSIEPFIDGEPARLLSGQAAEQIRKSLASLIPAKLDSLIHLRFYSLRIEGMDLIVVQRAYKDYAPVSGRDPQQAMNLIFAIGTMQDGHFHLLFWKKNTQDESEQLLGLVHLKNGKNYLVNTVSDPESQFFRIYGIKDGKLALIFSGGGGGC